MKRALLLIAVFLHSLIGSAAEPHHYIGFVRSPISSGLTQQSVRQSFQDSRGAIWFVTQEGLNRYTGKNLESYRSSLDVPDSLSSDHVTAIDEDGSGTLWIATNGGGLNQYNPITNGFSSIRYSPTDRNSPLSDDISALKVDASGRVWLGYWDQISLFDPTTGNFQHIIPDRQTVPNMGAVIGFASSGEPGEIWVVTELAGLLKVKSDPLSVTSHKFLGYETGLQQELVITDIEVDGSGLLWQDR